MGIAYFYIWLSLIYCVQTQRIGYLAVVLQKKKKDGVL